MKKKLTDKDIENSIMFIATALDLYEEDNKIIIFECPTCGQEARSSLIMFDGDLHGAIECKTCDTFVRI